MIILFSCKVIDPEQVQSYSFSYSSIIKFVYGAEEDAKSSRPVWTGDPGKVTYSIEEPSFSDIVGDVDIDPLTGIVSVRNSAAVAHELWTVIASVDDSTYNAEIEIFITPQELEPFTLNYADTIEIIWDDSIPEIAPNVSGCPEGIKLSYSIRPDLPDGLVYSQTTGIISGTLTEEGTQSTVYTMTATALGNYYGTATAAFKLKVTTASVSIEYSSAALMANYGIDIGKLTPTVSPANAAGKVSYSIDPDLNADTGLDFNTDTGEISGTPNKTLNTKNYTVSIAGKNGTKYDGKTADTTVSVAVKIAISGTFSYADLEVGTGQTKRSSNAAWDNAEPGQMVRYILLNPPAGISIDENSGVVRVDANVLSTDTSCSIRAEGTGDYTGETTAELMVSIRDWIPSSAALTYSDIRVSTGNSETSSPQWSIGSYELKYSMVPLNGGTLPDGISIDSSSGKITVGSSAAAQADTLYKVTAAGINSWKGWKKAEIRISVYDTFYYEFKPALVNQAFSLSPGNAPESVEYSASPSLPAGLDLNPQTGEIHGTPTTRQLATEYTITAIPTGGGAAISNKVYLFIQKKATDERTLRNLIAEEISAQGNTADLGLISTSSITQMSSLFDSNTTFNGDISAWDVSNVTEMGSMFYGATAFNGDLSEWDVSKVINMSSMFQKAAAFDGDLSEWDVSSVTAMNSMFREAAAFNGDLSEWNVSSVTDMNSLFQQAAAFNGNLSEWKTSSAESMQSMFYGAAAFNGDISEWEVSQVTSMNFMFYEAAAFNGDLSEWNVSNVTNMASMFYGAAAFNGDLSEWKTSSAEFMNSMFYGAAAFNGDLSKWDVSNVGWMNEMFRSTETFNSDISGWNVSGVTLMHKMFYDAKGFNRNLEAWEERLGQGVHMADMFTGSGLENNTPTWYP